MDIDTNKLEKVIITEAANQILSAQDGEVFSRLLREVKVEVDRRIDSIFAERADAIIAAAVDEAVKDGFDREYHRVDEWGKREGEMTSIRRELSHIVGGYWAERVDAQGRPSKSFSSATRAEWQMAKICSEDFSERMKSAAVNVTAELKDGLRAQLASHVDGLLDSLFKVKSVQDQGRAKKPW